MIITKEETNLEKSIKSVQNTVDATPKVALNSLENLSLDAKNVIGKILSIPKNK